MKNIVIYDSTLRDGTQGDGVSLSVEDKLKIARKLDEFGVFYIEGGFPGSNEKDAKFFQQAKKEKWESARLVAFGSTRKKELKTEEDENIQALLQAETPVVAIFGKAWDLHVEKVLETTVEENLAMIGESVAYLKERDKEVIYDAEHFFDGWKSDWEYAIETIIVAIEAGADYIVLCDTNGGTFTHEIENIVKEVINKIEEYCPGKNVKFGIHAHNDRELAVANTIAAVRSGAVMVQGTVNGYGERCGNASLTSVIPNLHEMGYSCVPNLTKLTKLSSYVSEVANITPYKGQSFVGRSAFAHKGGYHVSAVMKDPVTYEYMDPANVGNKRRVVVSDLSGKSNIEYKSTEMGINLGSNGFGSGEIVKKIKELEEQGYQFDAADASLELLMKRYTGKFIEPFELMSFRVSTEKNGAEACKSFASIKILVGGEEEYTVADGEGLVNALDNALRKALIRFYPQVKKMGLVDFKVRIINGNSGTGAKVRVHIDSRDESGNWGTMGASKDVLEASWRALSDSVKHGLTKEKL